MQKKIVLAVIAIIGLASIAYAAFSQTLTINGSGTAKQVDWDVKITNITQTSATGATDPTAPTYTDTSATFATELAYPGATATYDVTVANAGSIDAKLDTITDLATLNAAAPSYVTYAVSGVTAGSTTLASGGTNTIQVTVTWDGASNPTMTADETKTATINFDYSQDT